MKNVNEIRCESWDEYRIRIIGDQFPDKQFRKGRFLFRGQGRESWTLGTTFDRWYKGPTSSKNEAAHQLFKEFEQECEFEDIPPSVRADPELMLGLAQHNGLPTRLLDWSESPYVAAFFAFSGYVRAGIELEKYVAVWVLDTDNRIWDEQHGCGLVKVPAIWNPRIRNQFGRFTYLKAPYSSLEEHVAHFDEGEVELKKYLVPVRDFRLAMAELDAMGLTHARLFPGLEGNARAAEMRVTLQRLDEQRGRQ